MVDQWASARRAGRVSLVRATIEVAIALNLTDAKTADWLLRELGEATFEATRNECGDIPSWNSESVNCPI